MSTRLVKNIPFDSAAITRFDPAVGDDRYKNSPLSDLGPSFLTFEETGQTDRWTVGYEEVLYVITGVFTVHVWDTDGDEHGGDYTVVGREGDVITIAKNQSVSYSGDKGTRAFVCFTPLNWQDLID
jgi:ethanolamine utilization protein EutQ (cupin superfamily)